MKIELDAFAALAAREHGLVVVTTQRADGSMQASLVNAGVLEHPRTGGRVVGFVARSDSLKIRHVRPRPRVTVVARTGWEWAAVEGDADVIGPDDPADGVDAEALRVLLRAVFTAAGGTHDDWPTFDRVMADERRAAVFVTPGRIYSNG
jgi:PPOX class probable F420-dependent enzyme